jgi:HEAT repeat protein
VWHYIPMKDPMETQLKGGAQRPGPGPVEMATQVADDPAKVARLVALLENVDPRVRGGAADALAALADRDAAQLVPHVEALAIALGQEETQTRVGAQHALAVVARVAPESLEVEFDQVRLGAFDPHNLELRRWAALAIGRYGAGHEARGRRAFPHLAEALRRFHDAPRAADLMEGVALLARADASEWLKAEIWKAARKHEKHPDSAVRALVAEIGGRVRSPA